MNKEDEIKELLINSLAIMDEKGKLASGAHGYMLWQRDWDNLRMSIFKSIELMIKEDVEFPGLSTLISTGKIDKDIGATLPPLDSDVK